MKKVISFIFILIPFILSSCNNTEVGAISKIPSVEKLWEYDSVNALGFSLVGNTVFSQEFAKTGNYTGQLLGYDLTNQKLNFRVPYTESTDKQDVLFRRGNDYVSQDVVGKDGVQISRYLDGRGPAIQVFGIDGKVTKIVRQIDVDDGYFGLQKIQILDDLVLVSTKYHLYAYSFSDLKNPSVVSNPIWIKDYVYVHDGFYNLSAVSTDDVKKIIYTLSYDIRDKSNEHLYLKAFQKDGSEIWAKDVYEGGYKNASGRHGARLTAKDGNVIVFRSESTMASFDSQGNKIWDTSSLCQENGAYQAEYAQISRGMIFLSPGGSSALCAFNLGDGSRKWVFDPKGAGFINRFSIVNNVLYACNSVLYALDTETGRVLAQTGVGASAELGGGTVLYDAPRNQLLIWADKLWAYRPIK